MDMALREDDGMDAKAEKMAMEIAERDEDTPQAGGTGSSADPLAMEATTQVAPGTAMAPASIVSSLQEILDRLRSTNQGDIDLRAVDDLCFQIRFEAQVIAQQHKS